LTLIRARGVQKLGPEEGPRPDIITDLEHRRRKEGKEKGPERGCTGNKARTYLSEQAVRGKGDGGVWKNRTL